MACSGIAYCESLISSQLLIVEKTKRIVNLAIEMINYIKKQTYGSGQNIKVKIGIHTGKVIAGVIGSHKPQFSLIGDTINTASRICSNANEQTILLSDEAYNKMSKDQIQMNYIKREIKNVKGKGDLITHQLNMGYGRKNTEKSLFREKISKVLPQIKARRLLSVVKHSEFINPILKIKEEIKMIEEIKECERKNPFRCMIDKIKSFISNWNKSKQKKKTLNKRSEFQYSINIYDLSEYDIISKKEFFNINNSKNEINESKEIHKKYIDNILRFQNKLFLTFEDKQYSLEKDFHEYMIHSYGNDKKYLLMLLFCLYLIQTFSLVLLNESFFDGYLFVIIIIRAVFCLFALIFYFFLKNLLIKWYFKIILFLFLYLGIIVSVYQLSKGIIISEIEDIQLMEVALIYTIALNCNFMGFVGVSFFGVLTIASSLLALTLKQTIHIENFFFIYFVVLLNSIKVYLQTRYHVEIFNTLLQIETKKNEQNNLVSQLLPYHVFFFFNLTFYLKF